MADPPVIFADGERFLTGWVRSRLAARHEPVCKFVEVGDTEPLADPFPDRLIVIRFDGSTRTSLLTRQATYGVSTLAGTPESPDDAITLARIVHALLSSCADDDPENPVADVLEANGPYRVPEDQPRARLYSTFTFAEVGQPLQ